MKNQTDISTRSKRLKLTVGKIYWNEVSGGIVSLGYKKLSEGGAGRWLKRWPKGGGKYAQKVIALADDVIEADGEEVLTHFQAIQKLSDANQKERGGIHVRRAAENYLHSIRHKKDYQGIKADVENHILPELGEDAVNDLSKTRIEKWLSDLVQNTPRRNHNSPAESDRAAKVTANKKLAYLKALLNFAYDDDDNKIETDKAWRKVKQFSGKAVARGRVHRYTANDLQLIINACDGGFRNLVIGMTKLGTRPGAEIGNILVSDFDEELGEIHIRDGKTGPRDVVLDSEGIEFFRRMTAGRNKKEVMFMRDLEAVELAADNMTREELYELVWTTPISEASKGLGLSDQGLRKACKRRGVPVPGRGYWAKVKAGQDVERIVLPDQDPEASLEIDYRWKFHHYAPRWKEALDRVGLDTEATFYALRHTYASLALLAGGVPQIVAENMGTSVEMLEEYYSKFMKSDRRQMFESAAPKVGIGDSTIVNLSAHRKKVS